MENVTRIGPGVFHVEHEGRRELVYVAGTEAVCWAFWNGRVYRLARRSEPAPRPRPAGKPLTQSLSSPMPATIVSVLVVPGAAVKRGDIVVVAEAMKMEVPIRAPNDGVVTAVHCREGDLVQPDQALVELQ
jgi:3-methylcrotonyl-CoA carboxylase alpha subunit